MMKSFPLMVAGAAAVHLTPDNFAEMTSGKTVFLKMYKSFFYFSRFLFDFQSLFDHTVNIY